MKKGKSKKRPSDQLSPEKRARLRKIASDFGVEVPKPGSRFDEKYNNPAAGKEAPTAYQMLVGALGKETLDALEKIVFVSLASLLLFMVGGGLIFATEAYYTSTGQGIPEQLDKVALSVESLFVPAILAFFALSSMLGLYKQSELTSGVTAYSEDD